MPGEVSRSYEGPSDPPIPNGISGCLVIARYAVPPDEVLAVLADARSARGFALGHLAAVLPGEPGVMVGIQPFEGGIPGEWETVGLAPTPKGGAT